MEEKILKYPDFIEEELASGHRWGCFIKPDNTIITSSFGTHGYEAFIICKGSPFDNEGPKISALEVDLLNKYMKFYEYECDDKKAYEDFLVNVLSWDRLITQGRYRRFAATSKERPYTRFYNFYLHNWDIDWQYKIVPIESTFNNYFECIREYVFRSEYEQRHNPTLYRDEMNLKEEADLVKQKVPLGERYKFMK